jgi:hypothetical protein
MAIKIRLPYNTTAAAVPTASNMLVGELVVNTADGKLYTKHSNGTVVLVNTVGPTGPKGPPGPTGAPSDYRLKENIVSIQQGLSIVNKLNPVKYAWKFDNSVTVNGFIAHEIQEVIPEAVTGYKDSEEIQTVDLLQIIPLLVKSIQELSKNVNELKNGN